MGDAGCEMRALPRTGWAVFFFASRIPLPASRFTYSHIPSFPPPRPHPHFPLPPEPRFPIAPEPRRRIEQIGAIDPHDASLDLGRHVERQVDVLRPHARRE